MKYRKYKPDKKDKIYFDKINKQLFQIRHEIKVNNPKVSGQYGKINGYIVSSLCNYYKDCITTISDGNRIVDAKYVDPFYKNCILMSSKNFKDYLEYDNVGLRIKLEYFSTQLRHIYAMVD